MDDLSRLIIQKLQLNFIEKSTNKNLRRIIVEEVLKFINTEHGAEEEDVVYLEGRIRERLAGNGSTGKSEKLATKQANMKSDDWSKVCLYMSCLAKDEEQQKLLKAKEQAAKQRKALEAQLTEASKRTKEQEAKTRLELSEQERDSKQWLENEKHRKQQQKLKFEKLKEERKAQLEEKVRRKEIVSALKKKREEEMTTRIALELKQQLEADAATKAKAKQDLKSFLLENEENQRVKQRLRQQEFQQDIRYMEEYCKNLEKQEQQRLAQLERIKAVQARQAEDAKLRLPVKKWVDPALIEKHFREKQAALADAEAKRRATMTERIIKFKADIAAQLAEKEQRKLEQLHNQQIELVKSLEELELNKLLERKAKVEEIEKMKAFKAGLDQQIRDNRANHAKNSMSDTERVLNSKLMKQVEEFNKNK